MATAEGGQPSAEAQALDKYDINNMRKGMVDMEKQGVAALPPLSPSLEQFDTTIPTSDGWESECIVIRPKSTTSGQKHPLIVYFHGGGYAVGSPSQIVRPAREWAENHHATVICPSYRHVPEHPWPQPMKDAWDIVSYLSQHTETDTTRFGHVKLSSGFIIGGVSAGGSLASIVGQISILASSDAAQLNPPVKPLPAPITGLFIATPFIMTPDMCPPSYSHLFTSWDDCKSDPNVTTAAIHNLMRNLQCTDYHSPWFSPVNVLAQHKLDVSIQPRVYLQACAKDPMRDDCVVYEKMLRDLGATTKIDMFPDDGHAAWTVLPFESNSTNPTIKEATLEGMRWLLEGQ